MSLYEISKKHWEKIGINKKKSDGIFYTPEIIVNYMVDCMFKNCSYDPSYKILDLASGCGLFYNRIFEKLYDINRDYVKNVYAMEKDKDSINILNEYIRENYNFSNESGINIFTGDALFDFENLNGSFDYVIGNPPYVGHKEISKDYSTILRNEYREVYVDKSDLYYCFIKKAVDFLKYGGYCSFILPRYFLESRSGRDLRDYLLKNVEIKSIIDIRYAGVFTKYVGVTPCIFTFRKKENGVPNFIDRNKGITEEYKNNIKSEYPQIYIINGEEAFLSLLKSDNTKEPNGEIIFEDGYWSLLTKEERYIHNAINSKQNYKLIDIAENRQGIITGCDKAFVFNDKSEEIKKIKKKFIKKWVKSKDISKYKVNKTAKVLIYTDSMNEKDFDEKYLKHLEIYESKLKYRREVASGSKDWKKLQWGRKQTVFECEKIIYPFKSRENRFAYDNDNLYYSADIYSFVIKKEFEEVISYPYLIAILNSKIYDTYIKSFLKKMGNNVYEYYPYILMETKIFVDGTYDYLEKLGRKIIESKKNDEISMISKEIDSIVEKTILKIK